MENIEKEYYESGALLHEYSVRDGRKHGPYRRYYESGALRMSATYRDGFMEGPEEEFFENGRLKQLPTQRKKREVVLQVLAEAFEPGRTYPESAVDEAIRARYDDYCTVRREMIAFGIMARRRNPAGGEDLYEVKGEMQN